MVHVSQNLRRTCGSIVLALATMIGVTALAVPSASARTVLSNAAPREIVVGPDGALWFTNWGTNSIGRITTAGVVTGYTAPSIDGPEEIAVGSDGALWFTNTGNNSIGRITTAGVVTNYTDPSMDEPYGLTAGPDGALWFTNYSGNSIGRITTAGVVTNYTDPSIDGPQRITTGPDGALWFTNYNNNSIGRITTAGVVTNYTGSGIDAPEGIISGPDGALWFTNEEGESIGRITTAGVVTNSYTDPSIFWPEGIVTGPDGALWFTNEVGGSIGRITTAGVVTDYTVPNPPTVSTVSPRSGPTTGGTLVTITGTDFTGATTVLFGTVAATNLTVVSASKITVDSPAQAAYLYNVFVQTLAGKSAAVKGDLYTSVAPPTVKAVSPHSGPTTGGTLVTITGTNFTKATTVLFGTVAATNLTVVSATEITVDSPAESAGLRNVAVETPGGKSATHEADWFTVT